jgi:amino-acid N-acetyltransferase
MPKARKSASHARRREDARVTIRKTRTSDVPEIHRLLQSVAKEGTILPRSLSELYDHLRDYKVCAKAQGDHIVGVCAVHVCWEDLAEVRSLVVEEGWKGKGIGKRLTQACLKEAQTLGINRVFVLTDKPAFFEQLGFAKVDKSYLPHKVWSDCIRCIKFPECDEEALILKLG